MANYRIEHDSMGEMRVPADALWGAQTQRSYENFRIGTETQPLGIVRSFMLLKKAAAQANAELGVLDAAAAELFGKISAHDLGAVQTQHSIHNGGVHHPGCNVGSNGEGFILAALQRAHIHIVIGM